MSGLNYMKLDSTSSNICNTTQLVDATECHYTFKHFWGNPEHVFTNLAGMQFSEMGLRSV